MGKVPIISSKEHIFELENLYTLLPDSTSIIWHPSSNYNFLWFYTSPVFYYNGCVYILNFEIYDLGSFDYEPPTIPDNVHITQRGPHFITVKWAPSEDNACLKGYNVYLDSQLYKTVEEPFCKITGLKTCTEYQIGIEAEDYAGNISDMTVITGATTSDKPPVIRLNKNYTDSVKKIIIASETIYLEDGFKFEANTHNQYFIAKIEPCQYDKDYQIAISSDSSENDYFKPLQAKKQVKNQQENKSEINKDDIFKFYVYPNPSRGLFHIFLNANVKQGTIYVYNSLGILVTQKQIESRNFTLDLTNQPNGIYFLKLRLGNNIQTYKLIKQ